jgi:hypothetical protein
MRPARLSDIPGLVALFEKQHSEMGCPWPIDNKTKLTSTFHLAIASPEDWLCLTGDESLLLATCFESPLGAGKVAVELCMCAAPGKLDDMIERYEDWAKLKGCKIASLGCDRRFTTFQRLYRRYGYTPAEMTTSKAL